MQNCDKTKIAEYHEGLLCGAELLEIEEHLRECAGCSSSLENLSKLQKFMDSWEEKRELSKEFDSGIMRKANYLITSRQKTKLFLFYARRTAAVFAVVFVVLLGYKNIFYDEDLIDLKAVSRSELNTKTDIKDFKLYITSRLGRELATAKFDKENILNYELMLSIPGNIITAEQKSDIKELLAEKIRFKNSEKNIVLLALDNTVNFLEKELKINFSFASVVPQIETGLKEYKNASLCFENGNYEAALEGYKSACAPASDEALACSSVFRLGFINECLGNDGEAVKYYKLVRKKYPATIQAVMSKEMGRFAAKKKTFTAELEALKNTGKEKDNPAILNKIAGIYLQNMDYKTAAEYYTRALDKSRGPAIKQFQFNAGWCYKKLGQYQKAAGFFALLSSDPDLNRLADYELALSYLKLGDTLKAARILDPGKENDGESPEIYRALIIKYFQTVEKNTRGDLWQ